MANLLWLQGGACSGNTMSFLNAEEPSACDLVTDFGINMLWHPSLGLELGDNVQKILRDCVSRRHPARHLRVRGHGDERAERDRRVEQVRRPADEGLGHGSLRGRAVSSWRSGTARPGAGSRRPRRIRPTRTGLQFLKRSHGGFLGADFGSKVGFAGDQHPRLPGAPGLDHPDRGRAGDRPRRRTSRSTSCSGRRRSSQSFTQTGCTRNMHFAYKVSATEFGQRKGCLFYDFGCRGPMTHSPCNRILWNRQSSKTRAGMPCMGCTEPEFPFFDLAPGTVFKTQTVMGVPKDDADGHRQHGYIALAAAAKTAAPRWAEEDMFVV